MMLKNNKKFILSIIGLLVVASLIGCSNVDPKEDDTTKLNELTVQTEGLGVVNKDPNKAEFEEESKVTLTSTPKDNFKEWAGSLSGTENVKEIVMDGDYKVIARFYSKIVFLTEEYYGGYKLRIMKEDGSELNTLIDLSSFDDVNYISYLKKVNKIAFIGEVDTGEVDTEENTIYDQEVYLVDVNSGELEQITETVDNFDFDEIDWRSNGLLFSKDVSNYDMYEISKVDFSTGNIIDITDNSRLDVGGISSPDGTKVAFISVPEGETFSDGNVGLYVMDADGSNRTKLIDTTGCLDIPQAWSLNGEKLIFTTNNTSTQEVNHYLINVDGSNKTKLDLSASASEFTWSPDGNKILYHVYDDPNHNQQDTIYTMDADGSNKQFIAVGEQARWSADSSQIIFIAKDSSTDVDKVYITSVDESENPIDLIIGEDLGYIYELDWLSK